MPSEDINDSLLSQENTPSLENPTTKENPPEILVVCAFSRCTEQNVHRCRKCNRPYCIMHANRFSPNFCKECFANLAVMEGKFTRTFEDFDERKNEVIITKESCTKYYMDGPDWPFMTAHISSLTDDELRNVWNFHFFVMKFIENENETRKIEKWRKLRETPTPIRIVTQKTTTKVAKAVDTKEDVIKKLQKQGLPQNVIDLMVKSMTF